MAIMDHDQTFLMDLAALLKALREERQATAQVVEHLETLLATSRDLDTKTAHAVTQAVQRATASLQQDQARTVEQIGTAIRGQHERLLTSWQQVVDQAARVQQWLPWKVALLLLGATLFVHVGVAAWWGPQQGAERQALQGYQRLALGLDRHLLATLYPQLTKAQQRALDAVYTEAQFPPLGTRPR